MMASVFLISTLVIWLAATLLLIPFAHHVSARRKLNEESAESDD